VNKDQQFFDVFPRKRGSLFAYPEIRQNPQPSVFHNFSFRNSLVSSVFHLYDFCWKLVPSPFGSLARPKKRLFRALANVTNGRVFSRG
jgi:hypothetical protein